MSHGFPKLSRNNRRVDVRPSSNVASGYEVCVGRKPAADAQEPGLGLPILLGDVPAGEAFSGGIPGVDQEDRHPGQDRFVGDKGAELEEGPGMEASALRGATSRDSIADSAQVLERDPTLGAFGLRNEALGDAVVCISAEPGLLSREFLKMLFGALRPASLERLAEGGVASPDEIDLLPRVDLSVGVGEEIHDPRVPAEGAVRVNGSPVGNIDRDEEEELASAVEEVSLPFDPFEPLAVVGADEDREDEPAREGEQAQSIEGAKVVEALVVGHSAQGTEAGPLRLIPLIDLTDLGDDPHRHLGAKAEALSESPVVLLLEPELVGGLCLEGLSRQPITSLIDPLDGLEELFFLLGSADQLDHRDQLHTHSMKLSMGSVKAARQSETRLLPGLNAGASAATEER